MLVDSGETNSWTTAWDWEMGDCTHVRQTINLQTRHEHAVPIGSPPWMAPAIAAGVWGAGRGYTEIAPGHWGRWNHCGDQPGTDQRLDPFARCYAIRPDSTLLAWLLMLSLTPLNPHPAGSGILSRGDRSSPSSRKHGRDPSPGGPGVRSILRQWWERTTLHSYTAIQNPQLHHV